MEKIDTISALLAQLRQELSRVFVGQSEVVEQLLIAILAGGHVLITGVPGLGKTHLVKMLAGLMSLSFRRIQFTPDLMPADILGGELLETDPETGRRSFRFQPGPIFTQLLLADEINRTPPKTQSALLEAMAEGQVTVAGASRSLEAPFVVLATQNPIELEGTYPLPEAQLDRFLMNIVMDYLTPADEAKMVAATTTPSFPQPPAVLSAQQLMEARALCREIVAPMSVIERAVSICAATRPNQPGANPAVAGGLKWGAGSRASQALVLAGKARALLHGRGNAAAEDIDALILPVLRHRVMLNFRAQTEGLTVEELLGKL